MRIKNNLNIIFEDDYIIVLNKAFGMLTQMDKLKNTNNICSLVGSYLGLEYNNVHIINRLDRGVGGLVLIAKNKETAGILSNNLDDITKKYIVGVCNKGGKLKDQDELVNYLMKNQRLNVSKVVNKNSGGSKEARLKYKKICDLNLNPKDVSSSGINISLLEVELLTGRHHQIRVQLSNAGFGIIGDKKYNNIKFDVGLSNTKNLCLLSNELSFSHPATQKNVSLRLFKSMDITSINNLNKDNNLLKTLFNI